MATVIGKEPLCSTELKYFKALQGMESRTYFDRYRALENIVRNNIDPPYRDFLAYPVKEGDHITFYGAKYNESPQHLSELYGAARDKYVRIRDETLAHYNNRIASLKNAGKTTEANFLAGTLKHIDDRFVYCYDDRVVLGVWGMQLRENFRESTGVIVIDSCEHRTVTFDANSHGVIYGNSKIRKKVNQTLSDDDVPQVTPDAGYEFTGWNMNPYGYKVANNTQFTAQYRSMAPPEQHPTPPPFSPPFSPFTVTYDAGEHGILYGNPSVLKHPNELLYDNDIPQVQANEGYRFAGWDENPYGYSVAGNKNFTALYKPVKIPWYKRFWLWLTGLGCLKWLLWLLLFLLLLLLLGWLLSHCNGYAWRDRLPILGDRVAVRDNLRGEHDNEHDGGIYDRLNPYRQSPTRRGYEGVLPRRQGVLPPIGRNAEIIPGNPSIIANRLNILMENEDKSILDFAKDFKTMYPDDRYKVVYYDDVVKRVQIDLPSNERERLKQQIPEQFAPEYELFVFDESLFEAMYTPNDPAFSDRDKSWHLHAVKAPQAWDITRGSDRITVAIVDNGFNLKHPELRDKVVQPYNVWTHSDRIFPQQYDHGTHIAGTAIGVADNGKGLCGIAPGCRFMPVQVGDARGMMTITSVLDGILYALYQGADVVNVSLASQYTSLSQFPENVQYELIRNHFKEEERLWREIMRIAARQNATVVTAAGNDNVLAGIEALQRPELFITVSAVDKNYQNPVKADFSNYGFYSTVSAPGVDIYSSVGKNSYGVMSGTSMAAPIVSGAVALMKSISDTITTRQIICILQATGLETQGNIGKMVQLDEALKKVQSGEEVDCTPTPSTGDVQVLLSWNNYNDLDLICTDPFGETVFFRNRRVSSGGQLEIDMNVEARGSKTPIENIFWPPGSAPNGTYNIYLLYYSKHEPYIDETPYRIKVKYGGNTDEYSGVIRKSDGTIPICTFTLGRSEDDEEACQA